MCQILVSKDPVTILRLGKEIREIETYLNDSYTKCRKKMENQVIPLINPSLFYSYATRFSTINEDIGPLLEDDNSTITNDEGEMAKILSRQY